MNLTEALNEAEERQTIYGNIKAMESDDIQSHFIAPKRIRNSKKDILMEKLDTALTAYAKVSELINPTAADRLKAVHAIYRDCGLSTDTLPDIVKPKPKRVRRTKKEMKELANYQEKTSDFHRFS